MRQFLCALLLLATCSGQTIINSFRYASAGGSTLNDGIIAYWKMEEASGTRVDEVGSNDLADNNTVTQTTGKIGNAGQFTASTSEYLNIADNVDLSTGDVSFEFCVWAKLDTTGSTRVILGKWAGDSNGEYYLRYNVDKFEFSVVNTSGQQNVLSTFGAPSAGVWYFISASYDASTDTASISVNDGTLDTRISTEAPSDSTSSFAIGVYGGTLVHYFNGAIDEVGFWKRLLTTAERTELYNGGTGKTYPF